MRKGWGCVSFSRRFIIIGWRSGEGESAEQTKCEALPASVSAREVGGRSSSETEVGKGEGAAKVERGQQQPEYALHATVPCPACGGGALPAGRLCQPGKTNLRVLPSSRGAAWGLRAGGLGGRLAPPLDDPRAAGRDTPGPRRPGGQFPCAGHSLRCRRGAERQVTGASGEGANPSPSPPSCCSESGPVARRQGRGRVPGGAAWGTAGDKWPPAPNLLRWGRRGALLCRKLRGRAGDGRVQGRGMRVSRSQQALVVGVSGRAERRPRPGFLTKRGRSAGLLCTLSALPLQGAGRSWPNPTTTGPARICRSKVWA